MLRLGRYTVKLAETAAEFEQVHRLNHRTFVEEIPQHVATETGTLVDKFHDKNVYIIAVRDDRVIAMLGAHDQPPFSITDRLPSAELIRRPGMVPLEVRLLAVEPEERSAAGVMSLLTFGLFQYGRTHGYTHFLISGVTRQRELYNHMGFEALGPAVGRPGAEFIPMIAPLDRVEERMGRSMALWRRRIQREVLSTMEPMSMLPGPVPVAPEVRAAWAEPPIYHRGPEFIALHEDVRRALEQLTGAAGVALMVGSGTLANEAVAATLAADPHASKGLMLVNGEFGRRLVKQIQRFNVRPRVLEWGWGQPWDLDQVAEALDELGSGAWVWGVHQESSTGLMNNLPGLVKLTKPRGVRVCADCVSSLGAVPVDLSDVYLATGATGKALSSYAGIALVFADATRLTHLNTDAILSYLDIPATLSSVGPRYTIPSPLMKALSVALKVYATPAKARVRFEHYASLGRYARQRLRDVGLPPLVDDESIASPVITSFYPPGDESSDDFVTRCITWGFLIGGQSGYLMEQRLVQIANMGTIGRSDLEKLFGHLERWMSRHKKLQTV